MNLKLKIMEIKSQKNLIEKLKEVSLKKFTNVSSRSSQASHPIHDATFPSLSSIC